jgi:hypothetical protein
VWDAVVPKLAVCETGETLLDVELGDAEFRAVAGGVDVGVVRLLLETEDGSDDNRMTTLEEEEVPDDVDVGIPAASELLILETTRVAVRKAGPVPSANTVEATAVDAIPSVKLGSNKVDELAESPDCVD